jgi:uncharacterized membrane protein YfcA
MALFLFLFMLLGTYGVWVTVMWTGGHWGLYQQHWPVAVTMTLGSFVAGATAEGGAAIAFPVFTKALAIPASDARTFGLLIQSVGMTMAAIMIFVQRGRVLPRVILWVTLGGVCGQALGTAWLVIPPPYPRLLFTGVAAAFGGALAWSRWVIGDTPRRHISDWGYSNCAIFVGVGILGGVFAAQTGSGIDMATFILLTLVFGIDEKISTLTTVVIMAINSLVGVTARACITADLGVAVDYWLVAIPVVVIGAPLGAVACSRMSRDPIIRFLLFLIGIEVVTTLWLVPMDRVSATVSAVGMAACATLFAVLLRARTASMRQATTGTCAIP